MVRAVEFQVFGLGCRVYIGLLVSFLPPAFTGFMLSRKTPFFLLLESKQDLGPMDLQTLSPGQENASPPFLFYFVCLLAEFCILIREIWFFSFTTRKKHTRITKKAHFIAVKCLLSQY